MATLQDGVAYFIMPDHLGAPHEIVNAANARVWFWDHDPYGNGTPTAAAGFSHDLRFPGQIYDSETRLHNNGFRDYSPALGRYVQSDPLGLEGGINTYAYANNNPLSAVDPTGTLVTPETYVWDIPNVVMGLVSFFDNLLHGNYAAAGVDFAGLGVDVTAAVLPGVPGGAAYGIAAGRGLHGAAEAIPRLAASVMHDHHLMPRQFKDFFSTRGIDIDAHAVSLGEKSHLAGVHGNGLGNMPGGWNHEWANWISNNPNATSKEIFQQLGTMMDHYNINHLPIHRFGK